MSQDSPIDRGFFKWWPFVVIWIALIFAYSWSTSGPFFFPPYAITPTATPPIPLYLQTPNAEHALIPSLLTLCACLSLRWIPSNNRTRIILKSFLLLLGIRYFIWRTAITLNFSPLSSAVFSLTLYAAETVAFISFCLYTIQTIQTSTDERTHQANNFAHTVGTTYNPTVDVLVPTHNEDITVLRRTVMGCQAMTYSRKTVYILNDGYDVAEPKKSEDRDRELKALATELGCEYIYYSHNKFRKAGNLNNALTKTHGELIVVMDADFIPYRHFLTRTLGFFAPNFPECVDLVQTPQHFYNPDYHCRNLGLEGTQPNDMEHFYRLLQPNRDKGNGVVCCGSSYVVRRAPLLLIDGFYPHCCVEDFQTSLRLLCQGSRIVFLNEVLSVGEAPRTYREFVNQRLRWLQGNIQVYFCGKDIPIWSKLNWIQSSYLISQGFHCLQSVLRVVFLIAPLLSLSTGISPLIVPWQTTCFFFLPFWLLLVATYGWAANYRVSYFWNEIYEVVFCFPASKMLISLLWHRDPFRAARTKVTKKQERINRKQYNAKDILPLWLLLGATVGLGLVRVLGRSVGTWDNRVDFNTPVLLFWLIYNTFILIVAILSSIDQLETRTKHGDRFPLRIRCQIKTSLNPDDPSINALTENISEGGAFLQLDRAHVFARQEQLLLTFSDINQSISLPVCVIECTREPKRTILRVAFPEPTSAEPLTLEQHRYLVQLLYTQAHEFQSFNPPKTISSILTVFQSVLMLRPLMTANRRTVGED
jgi:cellulose synthase (UDP-forming)